jgi:hypothetical protein
MPLHDLNEETAGEIFTGCFFCLASCTTSEGA